MIDVPTGQPGHVLIISHDVIGTSMAGPGIRYWEMARVLAGQQSVTLVAPRPIDLIPGEAGPDGAALTCGSYTWGDAASLAGWLAAADVVVANGFVLLAHPELASLDQPLALDLYDPVLLENLELLRGASPEQRRKQWEQDTSLLQRQLAAGDFFMCATERQRDLYIGALLQAGRLTPALADNDPLLRAFIDVVPFGLPAEPPSRQAPVLRGVLPGIGADDVLLLWSGGLWDWLDPLTLIRALPAVLEPLPQIRLVFLAGAHPNPMVQAHMPAQARQLADELGLLNRHVFFYDQWVPYAQRADFLLEADIAVSLHRNHLETAYAAVRSRFLDYLWAGLPSIVSDGDAAAELVRIYNLGYTVAPEDVEAVATAIHSLVEDISQRRACAEKARQSAQAFTWKKALVPLARFCRVPLMTRRRARMKELANSDGGVVSGDNVSKQEEQEQQEQMVRQIESAWQFGSAPSQGNLIGRFVRRIVQRVLGPLIAQQRDFNAATVKLFYHILARQTAHQEELSASLNAVLAQTVAMQQDLTIRLSDVHKRLDVLAEFSGELSGRIDTLHRDLHGRLDILAEFSGELSGRIDTLHRDLHGRLDTVADFNYTLNDQLQRLSYTVETLNDALAAADEARATLASHLALLQPQNEQHTVSSDANTVAHALTTHEQPSSSETSNTDPSDAPSAASSSTTTRRRRRKS